MSFVFWILAAITVLGALAAVMLKNTVHCALALTVAFAGLALFYLQLDAQFAGFAQILVYIGAVAILVVFAILLDARVGDMPRTGDLQPHGSRDWAGRGGVRGARLGHHSVACRRCCRMRCRLRW